MIDAPGPWGTGPFILTQGASSILSEPAIISTDPFAATWLQAQELRSPCVVLDANPHAAQFGRAPRLARVCFRNDLDYAQALHLCLETEGAVDLLTELHPSDAAQVKASHHARLTNVNANRVVAGIFNRFRSDIPFGDRRLREAFNLAVDRQRLVREGYFGYATPSPAMTPPWAFDFPEGLEPRPYDPERAQQRTQEAGWQPGRPLRLAAPPDLASVARLIARDMQTALQAEVQPLIIDLEHQLQWNLMAAEKKLVPDWDILLVAWSALFLEATPAYLHREFFGADGRFRVGPVLPQFDALFGAMAAQTEREEQLAIARKIDQYVYHEALALFLCFPQALYAVNNHVDFRPYRTALDLAETSVSPLHWSCRVTR